MQQPYISINSNMARKPNQATRKQALNCGKQRRDMKNCDHRGKHSLLCIKCDELSVCWVVLAWMQMVRGREAWCDKATH